MADIREQLIAAFDVEHREHVQVIREALARARAGEEVDLREIFRRAHSLKGAARAVDLPEIEEDAHVMEAHLGAALDEGRLAPDIAEDVARLLDKVERQTAVIYRRTESGGAGNEEAGGERLEHEPAIEFLRVNSAQVQKLGIAMHELSANLDFADHNSTLGDLAARSEALARLLERAPANRAGDGSGRIVQEARSLARALAAAARQQREAVRVSLNAASRLREEIERVAMVPASSVFAGLDAMVRDLAADAGLRVDVRMIGLDTQVDRLLLQALRDPVIHLLRNAIAHGVEPPLERLAAGKPEVAEVGLSVIARGGRLELTVFDDGRGPNLARIREVALHRRLISPSTPPTPTHLLSLVFEPGFSTSDVVDKIAGRGVGLSVVGEAAAEVGGGAFMRQRLPAGTDVVISTPLSAARQPVLLSHAGAETYGLPTRALERVVHLAADDLELLDGRQVMKLQVEGNHVVVPVVSLAEMLGGGTGAATDEGSSQVSIAVIRQGEQRLGVRVDAFEEVRTATVSALTHPDVDDLVQGAIQLEQDRVVVVINPEALLRRSARQELSPGAASAIKAQARKTRRTVLVVDDSVTTRTLEKSILEANGFGVVLAVDGVDALEKLRKSSVVISLIVADVEMPRMDGFQLLAALKADTAVAAIPVIMMTSRADPEDVRRGMDLGADAYLVKQTFDQTELLKTIGQLL